MQLGELNLEDTIVIIGLISPREGRKHDFFIIPTGNIHENYCFQGDPNEISCVMNEKEG